MLLKDLLAAVPTRFGAVGAINRHFVPVAEGSSPFYERMTVRVSPPVALHDTDRVRGGRGGKVARRPGARR